MLEIEFIPWKQFRALKQPKVVRAWLNASGKASADVFRAGMLGPHSGRKYPNLPRRSSSPSEFPANQFGPLLASLKYRTKLNSATIAPLVGEMTIGTNVFYSLFLRNGTRKMARRKMSDDALKQGAPKAEKQIKGWVKWTRANR